MAAVQAPTGCRSYRSIGLLAALAWTVTSPLIVVGWGFEPEFTEPVANLTVPMSRDAILTCYVTRLGGHKVGWVKADTKAIQAIHTTVVTHNPRVSVEHAGPNQWRLLIKNVQKEDAGAYMCQINTDPMKSQMSYLEVTKAPDIVDELTPSEERVMENGQLKLVCRARGHPPPKITWKRQDDRDLLLHTGHGSKKGNQTTVTTFEGEVLHINHVTKQHMGIYFCIASNGIPPSQSKRVAVNVLFPPSVTVQQQILTVPSGTNVTLQCLVESSPKSVLFWYKDEKMIVNSSRVMIEERSDGVYRIRMLLTLLSFQSSDSGRYLCQAKNSLGEAESVIRTHEVPILRTTTPSPRLFHNNIFPMADIATVRLIPTQYSTTISTAGKDFQLHREKSSKATTPVSVVNIQDRFEGLDQQRTRSWSKKSTAIPRNGRSSTLRGAPWSFWTSSVLLLTMLSRID